MIKEEDFYVDEYTKDLYFRLKEKWPDFEFIFEKKIEDFDPNDYYLTIFRDCGQMYFEPAHNLFCSEAKNIIKVLKGEVYKIYSFEYFSCKEFKYKIDYKDGKLSVV